jgi:hypothetical protein
MHFTSKKTPNITPYKLCDNTLDITINYHPYLGITFDSDLKWKTHINNVTNSCKRTLGVIRRNFKCCSTEIKSRLYLSLVQPKLEYGTAAWFPYTIQETHTLDKIQRSAARLCQNDYSRDSSVTAMLSSLGWPSLDTRRKITRLSMLYKITHNLVDIEWQNHLTKPQRRLKRTYDLSYQRTQTKTKALEFSFFPWTSKIWNELPHHLLDQTKLTHFKTGLVKHMEEITTHNNY